MSGAVSLLLPELLLVVAAMVLLVVGAFRGDRAYGGVMLLALLALAASFGMVFALGDAPQFILHDMLVIDGFGRFINLTLIAASALALALGWAWMRDNHVGRPEYPVLVLLALVGMMLMVASHDFIALYVGIELQSIALYVLASLRRDHASSSEAGLKYFVLGALSSGLLLYGISLLYGFTGSTNFTVVAEALRGTPSLGVLFGLVFICAALAFKVSAAPFHMWTPDVYEGAPTPVTAFFASGPKIAALALLLRLFLHPLVGLGHDWMQIAVVTSVLSMFVGCFAGLMQTNLKRLMAYSSIANIGYTLIGLVAMNPAGIQGMLLSMSVYSLNILGAFAVILCLRREGKPVERISDLAGMAKDRPLLSVAMVVFMFSLAGVPPLAGFFGKYFIFLSVMKSGHFALALCGVLTSVICAYFYLRIIKVIYFDDPSGAPVEPVPEFGVRAVMAVSAFVMIFFVVWPKPLLDGALTAAHSLIAG